MQALIGLGSLYADALTVDNMPTTRSSSAALLDTARALGRAGALVVGGQQGLFDDLSDRYSERWQLRTFLELLVEAALGARLVESLHGEAVKCHALPDWSRERAAGDPALPPRECMTVVVVGDEYDRYPEDICERTWVGGLPEPGRALEMLEEPLGLGREELRRRLAGATLVTIYVEAWCDAGAQMLEQVLAIAREAPVGPEQARAFAREAPVGPEQA